MKTVGLTIFFVLSICWGFAQSDQRVTLEKKRAALLKKMDETESLLKEVKGNKHAGLLRLRTLNARLRQFKTLLESINREMFFIEEDIQETQQIITALISDLDELKTEYGDMLYLSSKNTASNTYNQILYLFASETFNQLLSRYHFLNQYKETRSYQIEQILVVKEMLDRKQHQLQRDLQTRNELLEREQQDQQEIIKLKKQQQKVLASLSKKADDLKLRLQKDKEAEKVLAKKIQEILKNSLRENNSLLSKNELTANLSEESATDKAAKMIFEASRTRLVWPVREGFISGKFGRQEHPVLDKIWVDNLGIDITTRENENVYAVFAGKVVAVTKVPGMQFMVTLQHGDYFTVYARLQEVKVQPGQQVQRLTPLGIVANNEEGLAALQFQVWHNQRKLNPEEWLSTE